MFNWIKSLLGLNPQKTKRIKIACYCKIKGVEMKEILFREHNGVIEAFYNKNWIEARQIFFTEKSYQRFLERFKTV